MKTHAKSLVESYKGIHITQLHAKSLVENYQGIHITQLHAKSLVERYKGIHITPLQTEIAVYMSPAFPIACLSCYFLRHLGLSIRREDGCRWLAGAGGGPQGQG